MSATPRPWKLDQIMDSRTGYYAMNVVVSDAAKMLVIPGTSAENMALIVKSVNCHDDALAMLKSSYEWLMQIMQSDIGAEAQRLNSKDVRLADIYTLIRKMESK